MGVLTLKAPVYKQIAEDKSATTTAAIIVVVVSALVGLISAFLGALPGGSGAGVVTAILYAVVTVIVALIAWVVGSWLTAFVATSFFKGETDLGEMMRVTGYTRIFGILGIIPFLGIVGVILSIIGNVIGIREAAGFDTTKAILTAVIAGVIVFIVVAILTGIFVAIALAGSLVTGG